MALRALMKRRDLDRLNKDIEAKREQEAGFEAREKELETAIAEAETDEERAAVEEAVEKFEQERDEVEEVLAELEAKVAEIEKELAEIETAQKTEPSQEEPVDDDEENKTRGDQMIMHKRNIFSKMTLEQRTAMFEREDVKGFIKEVRTAMKEKRALSGVGLLLPKPFLGVLRENIMDFSKLMRHVNLVTVSGEARQGVMGLIPEAVWTECCGKLNELDLSFYEEDVDCWKVAGFFAVCNANLEDSDIDLASEILTALGYSIGYAVDKAIVFGLGTRMPKGFFTRLAETSEPADYPADARPWIDLHETNILKTNKTGVELYQDIVQFAGAAKSKYSRSEKVWTMNDTTYSYLKAQGLSINAAGAIVSGIDGTMPVAGGIVEVLDFIPDNMIFGGYLDLYLLAERAGTRVTQSEHVRFLDDQTVFKGVARYDGTPIIAEGFVAIGVQNTTPSAASVTFAPDVANQDVSE